MTALGPVAELAAVVAATVCVAWVVTYALHSTLVVGAAAAVDRWVRLGASERASLWRAALLLPCATSAAQVAAHAASMEAARGSMTRPLADALARALAARPGLALAVAAAVALALPALAAAAATRGTWRLRRALGTRPPAPAEHAALLARLAAGAGAPAVRLTTSAALPAPAAIGTREICLPDDLFASLRAPEREALLAHELAHLARRDPAWLAAGALVARALPFQPLNRVALRRLRDATEHAADDWAARRTGDRLALARALGALAAGLVGTPLGTSAAGGSLVRRVERLVRGEGRTITLSRAARAGLALGATALAAVAAPGLAVSAERASHAVAWNAPSRAEPGARLLAVRSWERERRDAHRAYARGYWRRAERATAWALLGAPPPRR